jgi:hypothetical protein
MKIRKAIKKITRKEGRIVSINGKLVVNKRIVQE